MTQITLSPILASGALQFAFEKATTEGKITILALLVLSLFSWTIILTKFYQLYRARKMARKFFASYGATRDPLEIQRKGEEFDGAPAFGLYSKGADELAYHLKNNPVRVEQIRRSNPGSGYAETDVLARSVTIKVNRGSFESVRVTLEEAA